MKVYKSEKAKEKILKTYDQLLDEWGTAVEETDISTTYGTTHVVQCGEKNNPPLVLFHGVGDDSALMWIFNAKELSGHFRIYAVDTIGGPGKSCPNERYAKDFEQIKWLDEVFDGLGLERAYAAGVSNGSYLAQHYGIMRPERVIKMICMSGSVAEAGGESPLKTMFKVFFPEAFFPTKKNIEKLIKKLSGDNYGVFTENSVIMEHYSCMLKGFNNMAMARHKLKFFNEEQLKSIKDKTLFLLGESDPMGDKDNAKAKLDKYNMSYRFFPGVGHGINHEISDQINKIIIEYFS
ncbi:MAG: alpha/beta hydrolase [Bacillota bacterium]|nr:alpha/beta hydrolase [Bacillota bacterium]